MLIEIHVQGDEFQKLLDAVNKDGQELQVLKEKPVRRDPNGNEKKPKIDEREPFPATILGTLPAGVILPSDCDIVAPVFPRRLSKNAIGADAVWSDLVRSDGAT